MSTAGPSVAQTSFTPAEQPSRNGAAVTLTSDFAMSTVFNNGWATRLWVGAAGTVVLQLVGDSGTVSLVGVPAGTMISGLQIAVVKSTGNGTTASSIVAFN